MRLEVFSFLPGNRRGTPLVSHQVIVQLIAEPPLRCELAPAMYLAGVKDGAYVIFKAAM